MRRYSPAARPAWPGRSRTPWIEERWKSGYWWRCCSSTPVIFLNPGVSTPTRSPCRAGGALLRGHRRSPAPVPSAPPLHRYFPGGLHPRGQPARSPLRRRRPHRPSRDAPRRCRSPLHRSRKRGVLVEHFLPVARLRKVCALLLRQPRDELRPPALERLRTGVHGSRGIVAGGFRVSRPRNLRSASRYRDTTGNRDVSTSGSALPGRSPCQECRSPESASRLTRREQRARRR